MMRKSMFAALLVLIMLLCGCSDVSTAPTLNDESELVTETEATAEAESTKSIYSSESNESKAPETSAALETAAKVTECEPVQSETVRQTEPAKQSEAETPATKSTTENNNPPPTETPTQTASENTKTAYCDSRMITDWKLDFMAKALLEHLWQERKESVLIALDLIRHYYKEERTLDNKSDAASIQARIDKANSRLANLIAMRADGEISKDEYQSMRSPIDKEIKELQKALEDTPTNKCCPRGLDLEGIRSTLNSLIDFSGSTISHDVINQFVYMVTPTSDTTFDWYVNLNGTADVKATFTAEGRKKSCIIKLEEIEKISSLHRKENEDNAHLIKNPIVFAFLHRLLLRKRTNKIVTQAA